MTPTHISKRVAVDRLDWVAQMTDEIRALPLNDETAFYADRRNVWTAESCLRRGLEALFDLGRHILAKGFGRGVSEYKEIANALHEYDVLTNEERQSLRLMAGYRNRMVHFYHEIEPTELYAICHDHLSDLETIAAAYRVWLRNNPQLLDETL
jgi:uncharacterized protein YutE (UPF0331/DUF86 family)